MNSKKSRSLLHRVRDLWNTNVADSFMLCFPNCLFWILSKQRTDGPIRIIFIIHWRSLITYVANRIIYGSDGLPLCMIWVKPNASDGTPLPDGLSIITI